jgi:hypothetical protein
MPLSTTEIAYKVVLDSSTDPNPITSQTNEEDHVLDLVWATSSSCSLDCLNETLPLDEGCPLMVLTNLGMISIISLIFS